MSKSNLFLTFGETKPSGKTNDGLRKFHVTFIIDSKNWCDVGTPIRGGFEFYRDNQGLLQPINWSVYNKSPYDGFKKTISKEDIVSLDFGSVLPQC